MFKGVEVVRGRLEARWCPRVSVAFARTQAWPRQTKRKWQRNPSCNAKVGTHHGKHLPPPKVTQIIRLEIKESKKTNCFLVSDIHTVIVKNVHDGQRFM